MQIRCIQWLPLRRVSLRDPGFVQIKELYELKYPETVHGGNRKSSRQIGDLKSSGKNNILKGKKKSFSKQAAADTGMSERAVQRMVKLAEDLGDDVLGRIDGTVLATPAKMDALAKLSSKDRETIVKKAENGEAVEIKPGPNKRRSRTALCPEWREEYVALMSRASSEDRKWVRLNFHKR